MTFTAHEGARKKDHPLNPETHTHGKVRSALKEKRAFLVRYELTDNLVCVC